MNQIEAAHELQAMLMKLFDTAQQLEPGPDRQEALKEIGRMRQRLDAIAREAETPK